MGNPMDAIRGTSAGVDSGVMIFSLAALVTSFVASLVALTDYVSDAINSIIPDVGQFSSSPCTKLRDFSAALVLPLCIACSGDASSIFFTAIDKAGGIGMPLVFGIIPVGMTLVLREQFLTGHRKSESPADWFVEMVPGGNLSVAVLAVASFALFATEFVAIW